MSTKKDPDMEEIKARIEIPVEEDVEQLKADEKAQSPDQIVQEFEKLGRQVVETLDAAWRSDERRRVETEMREGVQSFVNEIDKVLREVKSNPSVSRVSEEATEAVHKVETSDFGRMARDGVVQGLSWMSIELGRLANQFSPAEPKEKSPQDIEDSAADES